MAHTIWEDHDVRAIYTVIDGRPDLNTSDLYSVDEMLIELFFSKDELLDDGVPASTIIDSLFSGISAVERMSTHTEVGWKKFLVHRVGQVATALWRGYNDARGGMVASWVVTTIERNGRGPDGMASALGEQHQVCRSIASEAGYGIKRNPTTGDFEARKGDEAREAAATWYLEWLDNTED